MGVRAEADSTSDHYSDARCRFHRGYLTWLWHDKKLHLDDVSRKGDSLVQYKENETADRVTLIDRETELG